MRCVLFKAAILAALVSVLELVSPGRVLASVGSGGNCSNSGCHGATSGREQVAAPTSVTAAPGATVTFTENVTGPGGTSYAVFTGKVIPGQDATQSLHAITGNGNSANILNIAGSTTAGWTSRGSGNYYTFSGSGASSYSRTFSFVIPAGTPADTYVLRMGAGGNQGGEWAEFTNLNVTVGAVPEPATLAMVLGGALVGLICWRGRKRVAAQ